MLILFCALIFGLLLTGTLYIGYKLYGRSHVYDRLFKAEAAEENRIEEPSENEPKKFLIRIFQQLGEKAPISPADANLTRRYMIAAGYRSDNAIRVFYGAKIAAMVLGLLMGLVLRTTVSANPALRIIFVVGITAGGWFAPNLILEKLIARRQERIKLSLPDTLDLMVVCVEAGLGVDQAVVNVARELAPTHPDISEELGLVTLEMRAGKRRAESLKNMADRTGEPELRKWIATMIQADRFGTSIAESLRTHSEFLRVRRRQEAEERAAKVGVKLVFPIFFFILPSMLVVAAGPGLLALFKHLFPLMKSF